MSLIDLPRINLLVKVIIAAKKKLKKTKSATWLVFLP